MKKSFINFIFPLMILSFFAAVFSSCASTSVNLKDYKCTAIASVYSNSMIPWYTNKVKASSEVEYSEGIISGTVNRYANQDDPEIALAGQRAEKAALILEEALKANGIKIVSPSTNPECKLYLNPSYSEKKLASKYAGRGYRTLDSVSKVYAKELSEKTNCDSLLFANFKFEKIEKSRKVFLRLTMSVSLKDIKGSTIYRNKYTVTSDEGVELLRGRRYDHDDLCDLADAAITKVVNLFMASSLDSSVSVKNEEIIFEDKEESYDEATMAKIESARKMLKDGLPAEKIAQWQNLPLELVEKLKEE